jgi:hypothetical protein
MSDLMEWLSTPNPFFVGFNSRTLVSPLVYIARCGLVVQKWCVIEAAHEKTPLRH